MSPGTCALAVAPLPQRVSSLRRFTMTDATAFLKKYRQEHLAGLPGVVKSLDVNGLSSAIQAYQRSVLDERDRKLDRDMHEQYRPLSADYIVSLPAAPERELSQWTETGLAAIRTGEVAVVILAGGQGTRLGFDHPKGMFDIGLPSHRTLFQLHIERLRRVIELAGGDKGCVPLAIMTSDATHDETEAYLRENAYFGLEEDSVICFKQGMLPCFSDDGKLLPASQDSLSMAPDGNGGIYRAMVAQGVIERLKAKGVQFLHVFAVDNALSKVADPLFLGCCIAKEADCGAKVVAKASASERVGVLCESDDGVQLVEYSELGSDMAEKTDETGSLLYNAANICVHFFSINFVEAVNEAEPVFHIARKRIPYFSAETNSIVEPESPNGIKLEAFIFDSFSLSENFVAAVVLREEEFAPVKNADSAETDCPATARAALDKLHRTWLERAGATVDGDGVCEVSPLRSYAGENLEEFAGKEIKASTTVQ